MALKISYRLALITGASSGLGKEIARILANRRIPLILTGRNSDQLASLSSELSHLTAVEWIPCDLTKSRDPLIQMIQMRCPDLLINNAGFTIYGHCLDELAVQKDIFTVNALAPFELSLAAAKALKERKKSGTILNISSAASLFAIPMLSTYAAAKAFLASFSQSLDAEMSPYRIRCLVSLPGQISTPFAERAARHQGLIIRQLSMTTKKAASLIVRQIDRQKPYEIIDFKTRLAIFISHLLPKTFVQRVMQNEISSRIRYTENA